MTSHLIIPDTQVSPGVPTDHIEAAGNLIVEQQPDVIVHIGDHWDFPSLSQYESRSSQYFEGKRYADDVEAGNQAMDRLLGPMREYNNKFTRWKKKKYQPRLVFLMGNHEWRVVKAINEDPRLEGTISLYNLPLDDWEWYDFQEMVEIDGILYSHLFINPMSLKGNTVGGNIDNKLKLIGQSFTMGHQPGLQFGVRYTATGKTIQGIVLGSFFEHDEDYMGPQANRHYYRGLVVKNNVEGGKYDPWFLNIESLKRNYL